MHPTTRGSSPNAAFAATIAAAAAALLAVAVVAHPRAADVARGQDGGDEVIVITQKFRTGEVRGFRMVQDSRVTTTPIGGGETRSRHQRLEATGRFSVPEVGEQHALMRWETRTVRVEVTNDAKQSIFDSEAEGAERLAPAKSLQGILLMLREIPEMRFDTKKGALVDVTFLKNDAGLARFPLKEGTKEPTEDEIAAKRRGFLDEQKEEFDALFDRRVKRNESWTLKTRRNLDTGVLGDTEQKCTLVEVVPYRGRRTARFTVEWSYKLPPGNAKLLEASGSGEVYWDLDGGFQATSTMERRFIIERPTPSGKGFERREIIGRDEMRIENGPEVPR